ncbi:MAG: DUF2798 domain-containing protein [Candidatus Altiarchaeota archaeon]
MMSFLMSTTMSFAILFINTGWDAGFPARWVRGASIGFAVGLPASLVFFPLIRIIVGKITK